MAGLAAMLDQAASRYGYREGYNNDTEFGRWYGLNNQPWCDMYITWCGELSGNGSAVGHFAYCPSHVQWFKNIGRWHGWLEKPQIGDIIFYNWAGRHDVADHVGLVIALTGDDQAPVVAREGNSATANTSEGVAVYDHTRSLQWIVGYGRPNYGASTGPSTPVQQDWDGKSFPGAAAFALGSNHPAVTKLGQMLVAAGFGGAYKQGPGVPMGPADVENCAAFQRSQGWTGADADGYPGPGTWSRLMAGVGAAPAAPAPAPAAPVDSAKVVSLNHIRVAIVVDGPAQTGHTNGFAPEVKVVEQALNSKGLLDSQYVDGSAGTSTFGNKNSAYAKWQRSLGFKGSDADGFPGIQSLTKLGQDAGFTVTE